MVHYAIDIAVQNIAQVIKSHGAYRLVMLETVYETAADVESLISLYVVIPLSFMVL